MLAGSMYEALIVQPPGPVVRSPLASLFRIALRFFNWVLVAASAALLLLTFYLVLHPLESPDVPIPAPETWAIAAGRKGGSRGATLHAWTLWLSGGLGVLGLVTGLTGLKSLQLEQRRSLASYSFLLVCLIGAQVTLLILLFIATGWQQHAPRDPSGVWPVVQQYIVQNALKVKYNAFGVLFVHVLTLVVALWLHSIHQAAYDEWLDDNQAIARRTRNLFARTTEQLTAGRAGTRWAGHLQDKFHLDDGHWSCMEDTAHKLVPLAGFDD